ncbi:lipid-A-disaccharide synthase [Nautilia sp.]
MCMQTNFGCCFVEGKVVERKSKRLKVKNEKSRSKEKNEKPKKIIRQNEVEFE